jgi:glycosyltransferase involved in cell wall biosynthesis
MERLAAGYDIGLVAETAHTRNRDICLANKMFTYLLAGIPAIMSDTTAHRAFAAETGMTEYLYPVDDPDVLASILDQLLSDPDRLYAARAEAYQLGRERYNWDKEKRILIDTVWRSIGFKEERMELPS